MEHDFIMATYLADKVVVYSGTPAIEATAHAPQSLLTGMNSFLKALERLRSSRDPTNYRPRINKYQSQLDSEQKANNCYYLLDE